MKLYGMSVGGRLIMKVKPTLKDTRLRISANAPSASLEYVSILLNWALIVLQFSFILL